MHKVQINEGGLGRGGKVGEGDGGGGGATEGESKQCGMLRGSMVSG